MSLPVYELDGRRFRDFASFAKYFSDVVLEQHRWNGNLDALNDILRGGFGTPEGGFVLRIVNPTAARAALGHPETARWFEAHARKCHPSSREHMLERMHQAHAGLGETLFDAVVEIIRSHGPGGSEAEDNVVLELAVE